MPLAVGTVQQRRAVVEVERPILVLFDKLQYGGDRPFRVVPLERRLHITPIDVLRPGESLFFDHLAVDLLVFKLLAIDLFAPGHVLRDVVQPVLLELLRRVALLAAHVILAHETSGIPVLCQHAADVHVVVLQGDVKGG